jgi:phosphoglycolate phosphatase
MGLAKEEVLYIGDSDTDIKTAINSGVDGVGVEWGFRTPKELRENGAKYIVSKPSEIIEIIKEA